MSDVLEDRANRAYLAGLIDQRNALQIERARGSQYIVLHVWADPAVVSWLVETFGGRAENGGRMWALRHRGKLLDLLVAVRPYVRVRRDLHERVRAYLRECFRTLPGDPQRAKTLQRVHDALEGRPDKGEPMGSKFY